jgi:hypothetical protein
MTEKFDASFGDVVLAEKAGGGGSFVEGLSLDRSGGEEQQGEGSGEGAEPSFHGDLLSDGRGAQAFVAGPGPSERKSGTFCRGGHGKKAGGSAVNPGGVPATPGESPEIRGEVV